MSVPPFESTQPPAPPAPAYDLTRLANAMLEAVVRFIATLIVVFDVRPNLHEFGARIERKLIALLAEAGLTKYQLAEMFERSPSAVHRHADEDADAPVMGRCSAFRAAANGFLLDPDGTHEYDLPYPEGWPAVQDHERCAYSALEAHMVGAFGHGWSRSRVLDTLRGYLADLEARGVVWVSERRSRDDRWVLVVPHMRHVLERESAVVDLGALAYEGDEAADGGPGGACAPLTADFARAVYRICHQTGRRAEAREVLGGLFLRHSAPLDAPFEANPLEEGLARCLFELLHPESATAGVHVRAYSGAGPGERVRLDTFEALDGLAQEVLDEAQYARWRGARLGPDAASTAALWAVAFERADDALRREALKALQEGLERVQDEGGVLDALREEASLEVAGVGSLDAARVVAWALGLDQRLDMRREPRQVQKAVRVFRRGLGVLGDPSEGREPSAEALVGAWALLARIEGAASGGAEGDEAQGWMQRRCAQAYGALVRYARHDWGRLGVWLWGLRFETFSLQLDGSHPHTLEAAVKDHVEACFDTVLAVLAADQPQRARECFERAPVGWAFADPEHGALMGRTYTFDVFVDAEGQLVSSGSARDALHAQARELVRGFDVQAQALQAQARAANWADPQRPWPDAQPDGARWPGRFRRVTLYFGAHETEHPSALADRPSEDGAA